MCTILGYFDKDVDMKTIEKALEPTHSRGPDDQRILSVEAGKIAFQRLAIMGLTEAGMQPFQLNDKTVVCNGEIYGFRPIKDELIQDGYTFSKIWLGYVRQIRC